MADQEDLFEHLEGASAVEAPSEYSFSHDSTATASDVYGHAAQAKRVENGASRTASGKDLDLDLDLDLTALNGLDLEDPSLDLHDNDGRQGGITAGKKEGGNGHAVAHYAGGILDDTYDMDGEVAEDLPPHACAYCGIYNTSCVVKCLLCNKW
jgi:regulator of nonsense transcripts 1